MINNTMIRDNRIKIIELLRSTQRDGIESLLAILQMDGFFYQAGSTRYHHNYSGGLAEHSLRVYEKLKDLNDNLKLGFKEDSVIIVSLMHDLCKIDNYICNNGIISYNKNAIKGHGIKSCELLKKYIDISEEEEMAIKYHMGAYEKVEFNWNEMGNAYKKYPLVYYTHVADMRSTYEF